MIYVRNKSTRKSSKELKIVSISKYSLQPYELQMYKTYFTQKRKPNTIIFDQTQINPIIQYSSNYML